MHQGLESWPPMSSAGEPGNLAFASQELSSGWAARAISNLTEVPQEIQNIPLEAKVPGCIHTDLLRAGLIPDPYTGANERSLQWIGRTDWRYETTFELDEQLAIFSHLELVCDGLDTIATISLNGHVVGHAANMHHAHRFDVKSHVVRGRNHLVIEFRSAVHEAEAQRQRLGALPHMNGEGGPFAFIRKMACNFGWDWGPALVTCGLWKNIRLEAWEDQRLIWVRPRFFGLPGGEGELAVQLDLAADDLADIEAWLTDPAGKRLAASRLERSPGGASCKFHLPTPQLWWPIGYGEQPLYTLEVNVKGCRHASRVGLREVALDTREDAVGRKFTLVVNGRPIFCKGFNWIPNDCFLDRACTAEVYRARIAQAIECNANMIRVWGGGIYETDDFYELCDELGLLVWQDFLFACAAYPEEAPFPERIEKEARENVARLSRHPSLVLWNGCNENLWGYWDWGWKGTGVLQGRTWGLNYYFRLLPSIVAEVDPSRPYWCGSPWSGDEDIDGGLHPNLATHGNKHIWEVWHGPGDYQNYRWFTPRFCSEFGYQGPPTHATWAEAASTDQLYRGAGVLAQHQKSAGGDARNDRLLMKDFELPSSFDDWQYLLQINQARALTTGCEWFRSRAPVCMGCLYWQFNDCWPATSWAAVDGSGRPKPLWYATRRFYAHRLLTIQPLEDHYELCAINDLDEPWLEHVEISVFNIRENRQRVVKTAAISVAPRSVGHIRLLESPIIRPLDRQCECLVAASGSNRTIWYYSRDKELRYPPMRFEAKLHKTPTGFRLSLLAQSFIRDLCIFADRLDPAAQVSDQMVTLFAGERIEFSIQTRQPMTLEQLTSAPVLQSVNRFGLA